MHDKVFAREIKTIVTQKLDSLKEGKRITAINVRLSPLSHVKPETLRQAFLLESEGTNLGDTPLRVLSSEIEIECKNCTNKFFTSSPVLSCPKCKSQDLEVKQGKEFFVESVETEDQNGNQNPI